MCNQDFDTNEEADDDEAGVEFCFPCENSFTKMIFLMNYKVSMTDVNEEKMKLIMTFPEDADFSKIMLSFLD